MDAILVPGERVGLIRLGEQIDSVKGLLALSQSHDDSLMYADENDEWMIQIEEDGSIGLIFCEKYCLYKGTNLVGLPIEDCLELLDMDRSHPVDDIVEWDDFEQHFYEVEALGLHVTVVDKVVESIGVNEIFSEDRVTVIHPFRET